MMRKLIGLQILSILKAEDSFLTVTEYIWVKDIRENEMSYYYTCLLSLRFWWLLRSDWSNPGKNLCKQEVNHYGQEIHILINAVWNKEQLP